MSKIINKHKLYHGVPTCIKAIMLDIKSVVHDNVHTYIFFPAWEDQRKPLGDH